MTEDEELLTVEYSGGDIQEYAHRPVPFFLKIVYVLIPIWAILWAYLYWNGSQGWLDRGYWQDLQQAANTKIESKSSPKKS